MGDDADDTGALPRTSALPPEGWYPDPAREADLRWWSGGAWTTETRTHAVAAPPPPAVDPTPTPAPTPVPVAVAVPAPVPEPEPEPEPVVSRREWRRIAASRRGIHHDSPNTAAVWVMAFLPILTLAWSFAAIAANQRGSIVVAIVLQVIGYGLYLGLVVWDRIGLARHRLLAPSLWWQLLPSALVYLIVRRVVLKRQGVISNAPGNVFAIVFVATAVLSFVTYTPVAQSWASTAAVRLFEQSLASEMETGGGGAVTVECPSDAPIDRAGAQFPCVVRQAGDSIEVPLEVQSDGQLHIVKVVPLGTDLSES